MAEHEPWHAPTGLSGLDEPAQLWWWVLVGHARELDYLTRELNLTAEQRRQLMRLQTVHRGEVATLAGHPDSPVPLSDRVPSREPDERDEPRAPHPG